MRQMRGVTYEDNGDQPEMMEVTAKKFPWTKVILIVVVALVIIFGLKRWGPFAQAGRPDSKLYQAVFLANGQVYFGKISSMVRDNIVLTDVYYLQVVQPLQQQPPDQQNQQPQLNLVKMGSEVHGPTDKMILPVSNVLFWENIKDDGVVGKAIIDFKSRQQR